MCFCSEIRYNGILDFWHREYLAILVELLQGKFEMEAPSKVIAAFLFVFVCLTFLSDEGKCK